MRKRIWRNGKYIELVVNISFTEEEAKRMMKHLAYSAGVHMGIPPAGYKGRYDEWETHHGWKLELKDLIAHQLECSRIKPMLPVDAKAGSTKEELEEWLRKEYGLGKGE